MSKDRYFVQNFLWAFVAVKIEKLFSREKFYIDADGSVSDQYEVCVRKALVILNLGGAQPKRTKYAYSTVCQSYLKRFHLCFDCSFAYGHGQLGCSFNGNRCGWGRRD